MAKLKNFAKLHGFAFAFLVLANMCPSGSAQAPAELYFPQVTADPATNYQLSRQRLMQRIEALGKEGAGISAYKAALEAIAKKSNDGVDEKQLILDLEKLGQEVAEQEQNRKHIKEEEAHPSAQMPSEKASGLHSVSSSASEALVDRANERLQAGQAEAQRILDEAKQQIKPIQEEEYNATHIRNPVPPHVLISLPADEAAQAKAPYEARIREIQEYADRQATEVLKEYKRQAELINPALKSLP